MQLPLENLEINQQLRPNDVLFEVANRHYMGKGKGKDDKVVFEPKPL